MTRCTACLEQAELTSPGTESGLWSGVSACCHAVTTRAEQVVPRSQLDWGLWTDTETAYYAVRMRRDDGLGIWVGTIPSTAAEFARHYGWSEVALVRDDL